MRKTKMICTIGPASEDMEILEKVVLSGMNASRHNFSHGDHEEHGGRIKKVKELSKKLNREIAIILDTKGPEIRTGKFEPKKVELAKGSEFTVYAGDMDIVGDTTKCSVTYAGLANDVKPGNTILIDDGLVGLTVKSVEGNAIKCEVQNTGFVGTHKGVNVPGVSIQLPALTEKDKSDLIFGCEVGVTMIAASFIRKASDVKTIREILDANGGERILICSKIENQEGVDNLDEILEASDLIMVARGDLGVEIPIEQVPAVQKMIIKKCKAAGKPVVTATQMLDSMMRNPRPTRAEVSDVANAILDGTDAIMLSGESANGDYPVEAVATMAKIAEETEKSLEYKVAVSQAKTHIPAIAGVISRAASNAANELEAAAVITSTQTGATAKRISQCRPECPIIAVTPDPIVARQLAFSWGVYPVVADKMESTDEMLERSVEIAKNNEFVKSGDIVVLAAGVPVDQVGATNLLKISEVK
ncbi:pyruvate kinase [Clostridium beijerinckii]|mgnify:CR=1 FL=1|jgi:pyruvate kinase (EC 2.7.1.40)|uniref:Pyruvate kinase n=2 Tax=Clostridium beijerinckii TaxID=1520 RepID=A0AAE2RMY0_CLOBE|nr:pyruvate kinase [Clostridium beijerinckii]ABR36957.1 pyruvate kinase [Clostridium beijerinckii NCIMB 8052]AIU04613.1 pyruvate kinase [Clostridium beijerinckii ATCC 35702]MBF7808395.1 pyruvate kinase [Clostridium beijerinckii]NRT21964.1 pyruvate kinase [Clostridium beijerinckii]NRT65530.1 pyruvate kinase [Clostridium beijerinckii]